MHRVGAGGADGLVVETVEGAAVVDKLGPCLDDLHAATGAPITVRRPWLAAWVESFPGYEPCAVVVREPARQRLAAVALLCRRVGRDGTEVAALGHGRNDRSRLPARDGAAAAALARGVVDHLLAMPPPWRLRLEQLPAGDPVAEGITALLPTARCIRSAPVPKVVFGDPADGIDAYLGKGLRKQLRRCRQRFEGEGATTELAFVTDADRIEAVIGDIERTHRARDHSVGRVSDIDDRAAQAFWRRVILDHARLGAVEIALLRVDRELAAYVVSLLDGTSYRVLDGRFAPEWSRFSPGRLVETATIERALRAGRFSELDWMNSVASEKLVASNALEETEHLVAFSPDLLSLTDAEAAVIVLDEDVEGQPTADRALAALAAATHRLPGWRRVAGPAGSRGSFAPAVARR